MNPKLRHELIGALRLEDREVYDIDGLLDLADLKEIADVPGHAELRYSPWTPVTQPRLQGEEDRTVDMFRAIRHADLLVHHPYDSFATSVERFVEQAVEDPDVIAIKQTVYRTSDDSPLVPSLIRASERGKQAVCMVELKARFDEEANIHWAKALEEAGVHVVYGIPGLKTHVKAILVARREGQQVREYVHVGTGNYHAKTARLYTDFGLFTADPDIGADVAEMFNFLTGYGRPAVYRKMLVSPTTMRDRFIEEIEATVAAHEAGEDARIALKMNSLVDAGLHPGALPGLAGGRAGRPQRARDLLPEAGRAGGLGEHPGDVDRRPLPRALARLHLPPRRRDPGADGLRRHDAAQPRQPGRAGRAGRRRGAAGGDDGRAGALLRRQLELLGARRRTASGRGSCAAEGEPRRDVQAELRERAATRAAEQLATARECRRRARRRPADRVTDGD